MKGLVQILLPITIFVIGLAIVLHSSVGTTPIYYHALPEIKFLELFSSFKHTQTNIERTIMEDSDRIFGNIVDFPINWNDEWNPSDFMLNVESELGDSLGNSAEKYFGSVGITEGNIKVKISKMDSKVEYDLGKLAWEFTYNLHMLSKLTGSGIANEIDTTTTLKKEFDFLDLNEVYNCANNFFSRINNKPYEFSRESSYNIQEGLKQDLNAIFKDCSECSDFNPSLKLSVECGAQECDCKKINQIPITLTLSQTGKGSVSFSKDFTNFQCGSGAGFCSTGLECGTRDCISGICGTCWNNNLGSPCSPKGTEERLGGNYRCYKTIEEKYKCLPDYNLKIILDKSEISNGATIPLNCVNKHQTLKILGLPDYFFEFEGVKIEGGNLDLCTLPRYNGRLLIYASSGDYDYAFGGMNLNFKLSDYIRNINDEDFVYKFDKLDCDEFKGKVKEEITGIITILGIERDTYNLELLDISCSGQEVSWWEQQYSRFRVDFIENSKIIASVYHIIEYDSP